MINGDKELHHLKEILNNHPKGLTIAEIAKLLNLNRISTSKYLNILLVSGQAEMRVHGPSKVFYPAQRVPISSMLNLSSSLFLLMNDNLSIIDVNNIFLNCFSLKKSDLIGHRIDFSPIGSYFTPNLLKKIKNALNSIETSFEDKWEVLGEEKIFKIKIIPTLLEDGSLGVTLIIDDVTKISKYQLNLEQLVDEHSKELIIINKKLKKEITNLKKTRSKMKINEQKYRELVENANCLIVKIDSSGIIFFINKFAQHFLGYTDNELIGKNIFDSFYPKIDSNGKNQIEFVQNLLNEPKKNVNNQCEVIKKDGTPCWITWTNKIITDSQGNITGILSIGQDITECKIVQDALIASEQKYRSLYRDNPSMFFTLDSEGKIISINPFGAIQLGYTANELEGQSFLKIIYKDDHQIAIKKLHECIQNQGELFHWQFRKITKTGDIFWVKEDVNTIINQENKIQILVSSQDITDQKKFEEKLIAIIDFLPDATFVIDTKGIVIAWNHAIETLTGVKAENIIGMGNYEYSVALYDIRSPIIIDYALNPDQEIPKNYFNCKRIKGILFGETYDTYLNPNGIYLWGKASPLYDSSGNIIGAIESFRDITQLKGNIFTFPSKLTE